MDESFGARMRQRRETLQIPLASIAEKTKIKLSLLEALERDDVSRWPSGIFRRAFIRAYAHALALDPNVVVREFLELHPDPVDDVGLESIVIARDPFAAITNQGPPTRFRQLLGTAIDSLHHRWGTAQRRHSLDDRTAYDGTPAHLIGRSEPELVAAAHVCTELGQILDLGSATALLEQVVRVLDAVGLIVWVWNPQTTELTPAVAHGYSETLLAQITKVRRDDDNATAAAFRSAQTSVVTGSHLASGALVVPMMAPSGCVGVLAVELTSARLQKESVRALATIFAAQLARLVALARPAGATELRMV